jgi:hypothetical protein
MAMGELDLVKCGTCGLCECDVSLLFCSLAWAIAGAIVIPVWRAAAPPRSIASRLISFGRHVSTD